MSSMDELIVEARRLSDLLDKGVSALRQSAIQYAEAEHLYRREHALAYLQTDGTVAEREAKTYVMVGELRRDRDIADGVRSAALEAVRARRTQLSALQSLLAAHRSEADLARTGPS